MDRLDRIAAEVISKSDGEHPADAVLRTVLKTATALSREDSRAISRAVFAYYRWFGWFDPAHGIALQLETAKQLGERFRKNPQGFSEAELRRAVPDWIHEQVAVSADWLRQLQTEPALWLRAKAGQGKALAERLGRCRAAGTGVLADALRYDGKEDLFRAPEFQSGQFELQDISSQIVGWLCNPRPAETWWDACAGEGGKLLHLSDLMQNKGLIWASDRAEWRLKKLKQRAGRAGVFNYRPALWDGGAKLPTKTKFDGILVDAPCSGIGTWQRNPHARWTLSPADVEELGTVQERLLENVIPALKPDGRIIYSVCTLARGETSQVVERISGKFPNLKAVSLANPLSPETFSNEELWLWPQSVNGNGMFVFAWESSHV